MTPQMFPIPPRITMQRMKTEMLKKKSPGNVALLNDRVVRAGDAAEERAARVRPGLRPHQRDAHRGRGGLVLADRDPRAAEPRVLQPQRAEHREQQQDDRDPEEDVGRLDLVAEVIRLAAREEVRRQERRRSQSERRLPKPIESSGVIPFGPFVRLTPVPKKLSPLRAICGRISPKPSVTIAR